jgi:hypothetical protein
MDRVTKKDNNINVNVNRLVITGTYNVVIEDATSLTEFSSGNINKDAVNLS